MRKETGRLFIPLELDVGGGSSETFSEAYVVFVVSWFNMQGGKHALPSSGIYKEVPNPRTHSKVGGMHTAH